MDIASGGYSSATWLGAFIGFALFYLCYLAVDSLCLSPIAHIPGPNLAALTLWYELYYDVIKGGQYTFKTDELHEQYGMRPRWATLVNSHADWCLADLQAPIFASILMKSMSMIQTSTASSM